MYNNYDGVSFRTQRGLGFQLAENIQVGFDISSFITEGATITPSISLSAELDRTKDGAVSGNSSLAIAHNSREGIKNLMLQSSYTDN